MTHSHLNTTLFGLLAIALAGFALSAPDQIWIGNFSSMTPGSDLPAGWERLSFGDGTPDTQYTLVRDGGVTVVRGHAASAASGLVRRIAFETEDFPILEWSWKIDGVLENGDVRRKRGDDYPVRIYVTFDYDPADLGFADRVKYRALRLLGFRDIPVRAINYIWANRAPAGTVVANPFTDWVMMFALQSGNARAGEWVTESRNVYDDYRAAFGEAPPRISGIAIMTDSDNTRGVATGYYGDISLRRPR
jgi:hypothetical protein